MKKIEIFYNILIIFLLLFILSCAKTSENPVGPPVNESNPYYGQYEMLHENWIADFDKKSTYHVYNSVTDDFDIVFKYGGVSKTNISSGLVFNLPLHYYISLGSSLYRDHFERSDSGRVCPVIVETNNGVTNACMRFEYQIGDEPSGDWEWLSLDMEWLDGAININDFGNTFIIKARGDGKLSIILKDINGASVSKTVSLKLEWTEYRIPFNEFGGDGDITQCSGFALGPPDVSNNIGIKGRVDFDSLRFAYYIKKR